MARSSTLSTLSVNDLQKELARRQGNVGALERRRAKLQRELAEVEAKIAANGGAVGRGGSRGGWKKAASGGGKRPKNTVQLLDALKDLLKGKTMSVTEASEAVQKAGYQTTSANFRTIVNQTLINNMKKGGFKRVGRGQYTTA